MKRPIEWVLVADAGSARAYRIAARGAKLEAVEAFAFEQELPRTSEILSDGPGRVQESASSARHSMSLSTDPHRALKRQFARKVAHELDRQLGEAAFSKLVIIAPPAFLGDIRAEVTDRLRSAIAAEIAKDLTKSPLDAIARQIEGLP